MSDENKSPLPPKDQKGLDRPQNNRLKAFLAWLGFREHYKETTEYTPDKKEVKTTRERQPGKTGWDWMQVLLIPLVLVGIGLRFSTQQNEASLQQQQNNTQIAVDQQRGATLQTYLDRMSDLLIHENLGKSKGDDEVSLVARAQTLTTLRALDPNRKGALLRFLYETHLIFNATHQSADPIIILRDANLSDAHLLGADLHNANLTNTNLSKADLRDTNLGGAHLLGADLRDTNLGGANLLGALVSKEQLMQVKSLKGTIMPDGSRHS